MGYFFIIFSSFCIFVPLPLAAPASSLFLHFFFIFPSFLGRWGLEAEVRLFILSSFFHVFFIFPSFALEVRAKREGARGRALGGGRGGARGGGGGGGQNAEPFHFFHFFFILFSFFLRFFFVLFSFYFHFFFILFSFVLHFFFICVIIFSSFLRCRSPRSSFFLHFVFIFPGGLPQNLHFFFISLPAVLDTGAARGRGTKMQNDEKMMKK